MKHLIDIPLIWQIHSKLDEVEGNYGSLASVISLGFAHEQKILTKAIIKVS